MLYTSKKEIVALFKSKKTVQAAYKGTHLVWQGVRSCFGSGAWVNDKPWINDESWRNN